MSYGGNPPTGTTDPFLQFMPQLGFNDALDLADQSIQNFGPLNRQNGPLFGMPVPPFVASEPGPITGTPAAGLPENEPFNFTMPSIPGVTAPQGMLSGPGGINLSAVAGLGVQTADQQMALPQNEFDQAQQTVTQAKKAANLFARGRDAVQHVRNVKKAADVAKASSDVGSLLGNLSAQGAGEVAKQGAKSAVGQFIAKAGAGKMGQFLSSPAGVATSAGVGLLGKYIQEKDKADGNFSTAGAMGGGALQGAAIGSALGPIGTVAGAAIGAGVGAMQKSKFEHNAKMEELTQKTEETKEAAANRLAGRAILNAFPVEGIKKQVYSHGGEHDPLKTIGRAALGPLSSGLHKFKENLGENLAPAGYEISPEKNIKRVISAGLGYPDQLTQSRQKQNPDSTYSNTQAERDDLWHMVLGLDQPNNTVKESEYRPTNESNPNSVYYSSSVTEESLRKKLDQGGLEAIDKMVEAGPGRYGDKNTLGHFTVAKGQDDKGHYISYYDVWDLNPISKGPGALRTLENAGQSLLGLETPEVYGRIYYDPETGKPIEQKALGGHTNDPDYLAEGGEMIQHAPGDLPKTDNNGSVTPVTKTIARINGDKHTAPSGGVGMEGKESARIYSDQLHVPADLVAQLSKL